MFYKIKKVWFINIFIAIGQKMKINFSTAFNRKI